MTLTCCPIPSGWALAIAALFIASVSAQAATSNPGDVNPGAAPAPIVMDYLTPLLQDWFQPAYPAEAIAAKSEGRVLVEFVVEADGSVSRVKVKQSSDPRFDEAALAAVRQWKFKPGVDEKLPVAMAMVCPVEFKLTQLSQKSIPLYPPQHLMPRLMKTEPAHALGGIDPAYPDELEALKLPGEVVIEFTVDETGRAVELKVLHASHPAFVEMALRSLEQARFEPARQGPLPKTSKMKYPVEFDSTGAKTTDILRANHLEIISAQPFILPRPMLLIQPVHPRDRLMAGESGKAEAEFSINEEGRPEQINLTTATAPEFGAALVAAIEAWAFMPAQSEQGPQPVRMKVGHAFSLEPNHAEARLALRLQPDGAGVGGAAGLDRKLAPLWRGFPRYPQSLLDQPQKGEANIEFIIDRDGRARLPKILSASAEAFGWSAATAISQWVFERPMKGGEPVDVLVRIPVTFQLPK